ncbi:MAG TPA: ECF transporter S component [Nitrolancea sp.]|jgi:energy-coupling factor transport system substrate-specific component|nr:ECF transporter S component [Nitrolancea sp.]
MNSLKEKLRFDPSATLVAITGVMIAVIFVATRFTQIPIGPGGYIHLGDTMVYAASFLFGPLVAVIAAAFGTSFSDLSSGYANYAAGTFIIHGLQGLVAGLIAWRGGFNRMLAAVIAGGAIVVVGYFLYELIILQIGLGTAWTDVGLNLFQVASGAVIGIPLVLAIRRAYPPINNWAYRRTWQEEPSKPTNV